jgi:hypothetical protein
MQNELMEATTQALKRFRWQAVPGTLTAFFGGLWLLMSPAEGWMIWLLERRDLDGVPVPDVPTWIALIVTANIAGGTLLIADSVAWWRCRNLRALLLTVLAIAIMAPVNHFATQRFPKVFKQGAINGQDQS